MSYAGGSPPLAIVGTGRSAVAALINTFVDIAYNAPDNLAEPVQTALFDTRDEPVPVAGHAYPLQGQSARSLHPFYTAQPPTGFPTFGVYWKELMEQDPDVPRDVLTAPTWGQVHDYLNYMLELAVGAAGSKLLIVDAPTTQIAEIQEAAPGGPAIIRFTDGTTFQARRIVKLWHAPHLAGPDSSLPRIPSLHERIRIALAGSELTFAEEGDGAYFVFSEPGRTAVVPHLGTEAELGSRVQALLPRREEFNVGEMWMVTDVGVGDVLPAVFRDQPVRFFSLKEFRQMMALMKQQGLGKLFRE